MFWLKIGLDFYCIIIYTKGMDNKFPPGSGAPKDGAISVPGVIPMTKRQAWKISKTVKERGYLWVGCGATVHDAVARIRVDINRSRKQWRAALPDAPDWEGRKAVSEVNARGRFETVRAYRAGGLVVRAVTEAI